MTSNVKVNISPEETEDAKVKLRERNLKLLQSKPHRPADYFYQVGNPSELAKIGQAFLEDFKTGIRSFAVTSTDYKSSQQRTVLALACYFDQLYDMKILIVSDTLDMGMFTEVMKETTGEFVKVPDSVTSIKINHFSHHFDLLDLREIQRMGEVRKDFGFETTIKNILSKYDIIFWDTPTLNDFKTKGFGYRRTLSFIESLTIIVSQSVSHANDVNELKEYFSGFGVNIKGVVFDKLQVEEMKKKNRKWGVFAF